MERDERYDPQDIEKLMQEKSFAELLADEQEFVLKHLENESEYEQVRSVMFSIKEHIEDGGTVAPPPELRRELIAAFKKEQKKGYRYWLNSISVLFFPQEGHAFWAPAMRFASVAALIGIAFFSYQQWNSLSTTPQLAELNDKVDMEEISPLSEPPEAVENSDFSEESTELTSEQLERRSNLGAGLAENNYVGDLATESKIIETMVEDESLVADLDMDFNEVEMEEDEQAPMTDLGYYDSEEEMSETEAVALDDVNLAKDVQVVSTAEGTQFADRIVTSAPASALNEIVEVAPQAMTESKRLKKEKRMIHKNSRSLSQDAQLIGLLVQAW